MKWFQIESKMPPLILMNVESPYIMIRDKTKGEKRGWYNDMGKVWENMHEVFHEVTHWRKLTKQEQNNN